MMDESSPRPEPGGALVPPPRVPPAALATLPDPVPPRPIRDRHGASSRGPLRELVEKLLAGTFDTLDSAGDAVAHALGIRDD